MQQIILNNHIKKSQRDSANKHKEERGHGTDTETLILEFHHGEMAFTFDGEEMKGFEADL